MTTKNIMFHDGFPGLKLMSGIGLLLTTFQASAQSPLDAYIKGSNTFTVVGNAANKLSAPHDLDFVPGRPGEFWVLNKEANGGSVVVFYDAGQPTQTVEFRRDSHNEHFMSRCVAIAMGDNGNFASAQEIKSTSSGTSTFMGPALWSYDTAIFARTYQSNWDPALPLGSHLDMLHQSPFGMGIAHDHDNVYWYFDGQNGNICKYDFAMPHAIGGDDHGDGIIHRYTSVSVMRQPNMPSHLALDKINNWLYIIDGGNKKIIRLKTNSGTKGAPISVPSTAREPLAEYVEIKDALVETAVTTGLVSPCGIDYRNNRLVVTDNSTGDVIIYDVTVMPVTEVGRIKTKAGIMGVRIDDNNKIWFVNKDTKELVRIDNPGVTGIQELAVKIIPAKLYPNPARHSFSVDLPEQKADLSIFDLNGRLIRSLKARTLKNVDVAGLPEGNYQVLIRSEKAIYNAKLIID